MTAAATGLSSPAADGSDCSLAALGDEDPPPLELRWGGLDGGAALADVARLRTPE